MSQEFWLGAILSGVLFLVGTAISIFGSDIRSYCLEWRKNRKLRGTSLKIAKLTQELAEHERLSSNPVVASAYFWSGLFLVITVLMLLGLATFLLLQLHTPWLAPFFKALVGIMWLMVYSVALALHNKASNLRYPSVHAARLEARIAKLKAKTEKG